VGERSGKTGARESEFQVRAYMVASQPQLSKTFQSEKEKERGIQMARNYGGESGL